MHRRLGALAVVVVTGLAVAACGSSPGPPSTATTSTPATVPPAPGATSTGATTPHVMVIMEENRGYAATLGSCASDPYLCSLAATYAGVTTWSGVSHPSAPNYVAFVSGATQGLTSDCTPTSCGPFAAPSLGGQLSAAGVPWRAYMESMPSACSTAGSAGDYAEKHNPFLYFTDVRSAPSCATVEQPYPGAAGMVAALTSPAAPDFVWISPNLVNDMHDGSVATGDAWLRTNLAPVLTSSWFTGPAATVIVTMDENDAQSSPGGGQVPMVVISTTAHGRGHVAANGNHYGTLRSIEEAYGLPLLGAAADPANGDLLSLFSRA
ncbi:MAG: alkaline phosphatase family protein [Candidatus Dormibacteraeota bacterium]|nr:alkaline phosphatase family protein [Candidatus Dormibacteraeota bacterium]